ncbi:Putative acetyltransferase EpsM [Aureliella helgolandensis]|uniref:Acetyltransferase EpsM n=2 Tax=Aureliella helgolandensis TaxID=2527968 RepID=A0A518G4G9_9BACT|nr:Putative acetyltransferase EpsM [Aureliella helgolandensis]
MEELASKVVVVGAGGHAKVCIELLRSMGQQVSYCVGASGGPSRCLDVPVLQGDEHLQRMRQRGASRAFIAIGVNATRHRLANEVLHLGYELVNAISPHAVVSPSAILGTGVAVMANAVVNADTRIGNVAIINTGATVDHDCVLADAVHVGPRCGIAGGVRIGAFSFLGIGCSVIPDITLGASVKVGAGAVVVGDIPDSVTAVGVPAKAIGSPITGNCVT